jgi:hypothetical protein
MNALQIITLRAPQWATDPRLNDLIVYVREFTSTDAFGDDTERAVALRVLHIFAMEAQRGGNPGAGVSSSGVGHAGQVTSETEGQLSRSFSQNQWFAYGRYGALSSTVYGQELIELIRANVFAPTTRRGDISETLENSQWLWNPLR